MSGCCDPKAPRVYKLNLDGGQVGLLGVEQAFLDVLSLGMADDDTLAAELVRHLKKNNYIPDSAAGKYKAALLREYKEFAVRAQKDQKEDNGKEVPKGKMEIKILGPGCAKCHALEKAVREVVQEMGVAAEVTEVRDINEIARTGVLLTPGLMINGKVKSAGKVINKNEIKKYIEQEI
ncbi:MAG: thioredoxin family protein [Bacillota bacterium]